MKRIKNISIRQELFRSSLAHSFIVLLLFAGFFSSLLYNFETTKAGDIIKQRNNMLNSLISAYFNEITNAITVLAKDEDVRDGSSLDRYSRRRVLQLFKTFSQANKNITYIYSGYENGELLINDYTPPPGFNPVSRPWYQAAVRAKPAISIGVPYQEIKTKEWLISTSVFLPAGKSGVAGVMAIDSSINSIANLLKEKGSDYNSSYSLVINRNGEVIIHHVENYLKKNISDILGTDIRLEKKDGIFEYSLDGASKIAYYSRVENTDWLLVTVVEKKEIVTPIIKNILVNLLLITIISALTAILFSYRQSRRFSYPLIKLKERVSDIIKGDKQPASRYMYPANEIGSIATEIENLTEKEIYNRAVQLNEVNRLLKDKIAELAKLSITDQLTQLYNRHKIEHELGKEAGRSARYNRPFSVILFDIDFFKHINDNYGHQTGDAVLKKFSSLLRGAVRQTDVCGRWGGEEFLVVCPETDIAGSRDLAEKIREVIALHKFDIVEHVTVSAGCSEYTDNEDIEEMIKRADMNLYTAKKSGKNTVI